MVSEEHTGSGGFFYDRLAKRSDSNHAETGAQLCQNRTGPGDFGQHGALVLPPQQAGRSGKKYDPLPVLRKARQNYSQTEAQKILLRPLPGRLVEQPPGTGEAKGLLSFYLFRLRQGVYSIRQRPPQVLQPQMLHHRPLWKGDFLMMQNYRSRLEWYLAAMFQAKRMLSMGILTPEDYAKIDTKIAEKYGISSCSIYRQKAG